MNALGLFPATPRHWLAGAHIAKVISVKDPLAIGRVQVQLLAADPDGEALVWARVAVPFAGDNYGAFLIPGIDEEVLVLFPAAASGDPVVVGALWNGKTAVPESLPSDSVDRWTLCGKAGTRIAIVEEGKGQEKVEISTPNGAKATLTDASGGEIKLEVGGNTITMGTSGISCETSGEFKVQASTISLKASSVDVTTPSATFSAQISCQMLTATSVTSATYSLGAGNVW
jgi:uncharacterized protein involved in type VI secretion and phage assembly